MSLRTAVLLSLGALGLVLAGCQATGSYSGTDPNNPDGAAVRKLVPRARPRVPDLPVPIGFELNSAKSFNYAASGFRFVKHVYNGSADPFAVVRFYRRQMPVNGWTWVTDMYVEGAAIMDFDKNSERCRLTISERGMLGRTEIKVQLWTSGRIEQPAAPRKDSNQR